MNVDNHVDILLNCPVFERFDASAEPLKEDIPTTLQITCYYSCQRYKHIELIAEYKNKDLDELTRVAKILQEKLSCFISQKWGVTLKLRPDKKNKQTNNCNDPSNPIGVKLVFLRAEQEEFRKFCEQQLSKDIDKKELECYKLFRKNLNIGLYSNRLPEQILDEFREKDIDTIEYDESLDDLIPNKISP